MAQSPPDSTSVDISHSLNTKYLKEGEFTLLIPLAENITSLIGHIVVQWGGFELRMDSMIRAIFPRLGKPEVPGWERMPFKKRKKLFKDLMAEYTAALFPTEANTFKSIADKSGDLHWRRNIVAHGYVQIRSEPDPTTETGHRSFCVATGKHNGKDVFVPLDQDTLEKLRYDIAHLGGNLMAAVNRMGGRLASDAPELVIADRDFLQDPQSGSFHYLAMKDTSESPPQSSEE